MPRVTVQTFHVVPTIPIPSVRSYLTCSAFIFISGFYYYYRILKSSNISTPFFNSNVADENDLDTPVPMTFTVLKELFKKHSLFYCVLLNTFCAFIVFTGKLIIDLIIGPITTQEEEALKNVYRSTIQWKLACVIFMSTNSIFEDFFSWMPWIIFTLVIKTLYDLMDLRIANPQYNTSNRTTSGKYLLSSVGGLILSCGIFSYLFWAGESVYYEYRVLMIIDSLMIAVHSINVIHKIAMAISRPTSDNISHYVSMFYSVMTDFLNAYSSYHVYYYSLSWPTISLFMMLFQLRLCMMSLIEIVRKHVRHLRIVNHINMCYPEATKEDLLKQDSCTICWEPMEKARKLPCGHCFHEVCLRRWLQHDSSCAVCRTALSLHLSQALRDDINNDDEVGAAAIIGMEMIRFFRWFNRVNFPPNVQLNPTQVQAMTDQIANVFPQYSRNSIDNAVRLTGSVDQAVNYLLENGNQEQNAVEGNEGNFSDESETDEPSQAGNNVVDAAIAAFSNNSIKEERGNQDTWFGQQKMKLIEECRRKYLVSTRAEDLRTGVKKDN